MRHVLTVPLHNLAGVAKTEPMTDADTFRIHIAEAREGNGHVVKNRFAASAKLTAAENKRKAAGATATDLDETDHRDNSSTATAVGLLAFAALAFTATAIAGSLTIGSPGITQPISTPTASGQGFAMRRPLALLFVVLVCIVCFLMHTSG